jgi:hypothetical protein
LQFSKRACRRPTTQKIEEGDKVTIKGDEDVLDSGRGFIGRGSPHMLQLWQAEPHSEELQRPTKTSAGLQLG